MLPPLIVTQKDFIKVLGFGMVKGIVFGLGFRMWKAMMTNKHEKKDYAKKKLEEVWSDSY